MLLHGMHRHSALLKFMTKNISLREKNLFFSFVDSCRKSAVMLDRIFLGRFLCLSGLLWLLYGLNGAWYEVRMGLFVLSSTVKTLSNLEMPYTVMVPTIALCHSCGLFSVFLYLVVICLLLFFFLPYFSLIGCCDHAY